MIDAVTFGARPGVVYVPAREAASALGWPFEFDPVTEITRMRGHLVEFTWPSLGDGTRLFSTKVLSNWGVRTERRPDGILLIWENRRVPVTVGPKRVAVSLRERTFRAWQGKRLVFSCEASPGRPGHPTPPGDYRTGRKERLHISTIYGSPMPWSVHLAGAIYIHGSEAFDDGVGSHGCIRLPVDRARNLAEWFYDWSTPGTRVTVR